MFLALSCLGTKGVKDENISWKRIAFTGAAGALLFFCNGWLLGMNTPVNMNAFLYASTLVCGYLFLLAAGSWASRVLRENLLGDVYNVENESFMQETQLKANPHSVNLPTRFRYRNRTYYGWINIQNPYKGNAIVGLPGSGKTFACVSNYLRQFIEKGFCCFVYDYKYPDLTQLAYNYLLRNLDAYGEVKPKFYVLNFDDLKHSNRCNPINVKYLNDVSDAYESAYTILVGLNRSWQEKSGDFFIESAVVLLTSVIWYLRIYKEGKYCTLPHALELLNKPYEDMFKILMSYPELENYMSPFAAAMTSGAVEQLEGQVASTKIALTRLISPQLYWIMSGDDFDLSINDPAAPKILCLANDPNRQSINTSVASLYINRMVKVINKKEQRQCAIVVDELPTLFFKGLDHLIATGRSNRIAVCISMQDFSQLNRDYGERESKVIQNLIGNLIVGQSTGETSKIVSERFGKIVQKRQSMTITRNDHSTGFNTQLDDMIPASKISNLSQGEFVGSVADDVGTKVEQKIFHAEILIDGDQVKRETESFLPIPVITDFTAPDGTDAFNDRITENYLRIREETQRIVMDELVELAKSEG